MSLQWAISFFFLTLSTLYYSQPLYPAYMLTMPFLHTHTDTDMLYLSMHIYILSVRINGKIIERYSKYRCFQLFLVGDFYNKILLNFT